MSDNNNGSNRYAAGTQPWKTLASMKTERSHAASVRVNDHQFLMIGGYDKDELLSTCEYYDANTAVWKDFPAIPNGRHASGAAMVGNKVYIVGGFKAPSTSYGSPKATHELFSIDVSGNEHDLSSEKWVPLAPMSRARRSFACVSHSKYIYVFGGCDASGNAIDTAERYNTETDEWTELPAMPEKRCWCAAGCVGDKIYIFGGDDNKKKINGKTLVYNTTGGNEPWESSTDLDMMTPRSRLTVVVKDHFILAIGGESSNPNKDLSIEVLDTRLNAWYRTRTPKTSCRTLLAAGFLSINEEIKIILAGGIDGDNNATDTAVAIPFEKGILPVNLLPRSGGRPQKIVGDIDQGADHLDLKNIARTLARMLVFKDLTPPFVLGLLAKWGWGKSYFFNLILEELITIQKLSKRDLGDTYAGHIYVVRFNAWTYSKSDCDVMSGMMYQILKDLNEQLELEKVLGIELVEDGKRSSIQELRDLSAGEKNYMARITDEETKKKFREYIQDQRKNGEKSSLRLAKAINHNYEDDIDEIKRIDKEIEVEKIKSVATDMMRVTNSIGNRILKNALKSAENNNSNDDTGEKGDVANKNTDSNKGGQNMKNSNNGTGKKGDDFINQMKQSIKITKYLCSFRISNIPPYAFICSAIFIVLTPILLIQWKDEVTAALAGGISILLPVITSVTTTMKKLAPIIEQLSNHVDNVNELDDNDQIKKLIEDKKAIKGRTLAYEGDSLRDTVRNIDSKKYGSKFGIVHEAHQDLLRMTESMMNPNQREKIFPRGIPRVVLFIDDLDRCKHDVVVEAVETLQLLVNTDLFVSILAIDPRYVTLSIEEKYKGILRRKNPPSGMDFLEKIIQIPFRLPGVRAAHVGKFLDSQLDIEEPQTDDPNGVPSYVSDIETGDQPANDRDDGSTAATPVPAADEEKVILSKRCFCEKKEKDMLIELFKLFRVSPRCLKRIINVFKVLKLLWDEDTNIQELVNYECRRATVFLMLLASDESTRDATYKIFEWMEVGMVKYHLVKNENNLANLFKRELKQLDKRLEKTSKEDTLMAHIDHYLSEYKWTNATEWNRLSTRFWYARSFSFFHITTEEIDNRVGVAVAEEK